MSESQILNAIAEACKDDTLHFQIIIQENTLHIYINRETPAHLNYQKLEQEIVSAISGLNLPDVAKIWLYCRVLGEVEPDWQNVLTIEAEVALEEDLESIVEEIATAVDATNSTVKKIEYELERAESFAEDKLEKTTLDDNRELDATTSKTEAESELNLGEYCFIRNRRLLNAELVAPRENIARLIDTFAQFNESIKRSQLPILEAYFQESKNPGLGDCDSKVRAWWTEIEQLDSDGKRKMAIWLSRYCLNTEQTTSTIEKVFAAQAAIAEARELEERLESEQTTSAVESDFPTSYSTPSPTSDRVARSRQTNRQKPNLLSSVNLALPIGWAVVTLAIIIIGFNSSDSVTLSSAICENTTGEQSYCNLAVQMVEEEKLSESIQNAVAFEPESLDIGLEYCQVYGNTAAGIPLKKASPSENPPLSKSGAEIFSGIYVADVEQVSYKAGSDTVRTACIFEQAGAASGYRRNKINFLSIDQIDPAWPQVPYEPSEKKRSLQALYKALGAYSVFGKLGLNTLFTAVVIYLLAVFGMAIRADSLPTIYQASFVLGIVESILATLPLLGWWIKIPVECIALGITSGCVPGFKIDWNAGYHFVAATAILLMASRWLLCWLTIAFLYNIFG